VVTTQGDGRDLGTHLVLPSAHAPAGPAVRFARVAGVLYSAAGIVGLALTGTGDLTRTVGASLLGIEVNGLANLLHLGVGVTLVVAAAVGPEVARTVTLLTAAGAGVAGLLGFAVIGTDANVLALNAATNYTHLATAALATIAAARSHRIELGA
jgi:hypothetical protein